MDTGDIVSGDWRNGIALDGLKQNSNRNSTCTTEETILLLYRSIQELLHACMVAIGSKVRLLNSRTYNPTLIDMRPVFRYYSLANRSPDRSARTNRSNQYDNEWDAL